MGVYVTVPWGELTWNGGAPFASSYNEGRIIDISESGLYLITFHAEVKLSWPTGTPPVGEWAIGADIDIPEGIEG